MAIETKALNADNPHIVFQRSDYMSTLFGRKLWLGLAVAISLLTLIPLAVIALTSLQPDPQIWQHLLDYLLPSLLKNTLFMVLGVGTGVLLLGVPLAWLVAVYDFPGRRIFSWALMLPLAVPAYVMAFTQVGIFDFSGPVQSWLRLHTGSSAWFPAIRSDKGMVLVMSLAFYPYVYLLARNAFTTMGRRALEVGQSLGLSRAQGFWRIALPGARPWIAGGLMLALMETLADFGTVAIFNFDAFTSAIYKAWFSLFSIDTAKQLASLLVLLVFVLIVFEQYARGRRKYAQSGRSAPMPRLVLQGWQAMAASLFAGLVLCLAFVFPMVQLGWWSWQLWDLEWNADLFGYTWRSVLLSLMAAGVVVVLALLLSYARRRDESRAMLVVAKLATLGYAVPGTVLAVGIFVPIAWLDNQLIELFYQGTETTAVLKGTLLVMLLAYAARFLAVGHSAVDAAMNRITRSQEEAARNLGLSGFRLLRRVHLPLLRGGLFVGALMVFVDVMKEMPITMMTRPFGWDTLSVRIFGLTSEGVYDQAALPAIVLVLVGLIPTLLLSRQKDYS